MYKKDNVSGSKTAKLDSELFFNIGNGKLDISSNAINFMLFTINHVAKDGRIYCKHDVIRQELILQHKTLNRVINELMELNLLSEKGGFLYSHFHVLSNGEKEDKGYVRNIKAFTSEEILSLNKTKKRFFLYVASFARMGVPKKVSVEALYSNKYHSGVNYIESYQELAEILFDFVRKGLFVVFIDGKRFDNKSADFEEEFHAYCGYDYVIGKKRMSMKREHQIGITLHESLVKVINPNESSKAEFRYYADENHIYHEVMRSSTIPYFITVQNELFNSFEMAGLELYRNALISYFETERENVLYHDLYANEKETKAINTMVDFYLIKDIQKVILNVLTGTETTNFSSLENYFKNEECLAELVRYFIQKSSDDHKVVLEEQLDKYGIQLESLVSDAPQQNIFENSWSVLNQSVNDIFNQFDFDEEHFTFERKKHVVRQWAKEGILTRKEKLEKSVEQLKEKIVFVKMRNKIVLSNTPKPPSSSTTKKDSRETIGDAREKLRMQIVENVKKLNLKDVDCPY